MDPLPSPNYSHSDASIHAQGVPPATSDGWIPSPPPTAQGWNPGAHPPFDPGVNPAQARQGTPMWYVSPGPYVPLAPSQAARPPRRGSMVLVAALCTLIGAGAGAGAYAVASNGQPAATSTPTSSADAPVVAVARPTPAPATPAPATPAPATTGSSGLEQLVAAVEPSVVTIEATQTVTDPFGGYGGQQSDIGSGVIFRSDGWILTNHHVVGDAQNVTVVLSDGTKLKGTVAAVDSTNDFAIVKVNSTSLTAAKLGDSSATQLGESVVAIGSPLGEFTGTVTSGIVSGLDRSITVSEGNDPNGTTLDHLIQTDAAINPGNSGGPLFDLQGNVIGINTAGTSSAQNIGFALPINLAKDFINSSGSN